MWFGDLPKLKSAIGDTRGAKTLRQLIYGGHTIALIKMAMPAGSESWGCEGNSYRLTFSNGSATDVSYLPAYNTSLKTIDIHAIEPTVENALVVYRGDRECGCGFHLVPTIILPGQDHVRGLNSEIASAEPSCESFVFGMGDKVPRRISRRHASENIIYTESQMPTCYEASAQNINKYQRKKFIAGLEEKIYTKISIKTDGVDVKTFTEAELPADDKKAWDEGLLLTLRKL